MSLDMTMDARRVATDDGMAQAKADPAARLWVQDLIAIAGMTVSVTLTSLLAVVIYLA